MDLTSIFLFCLISLVIGAVLMILVQYYLFVKYFNQPDDDPNAENQRNRSLNEKYQLPDVSWIAHSYLGAYVSRQWNQFLAPINFSSPYFALFAISMYCVWFKKLKKYVIFTHTIVKHTIVKLTFPFCMVKTIYQ